jgi:hypothetical protein
VLAARAVAFGPTTMELAPVPGPAQSSAWAPAAATRPPMPIIAACTIASLRAEDRLVFDLDVSEAATQVPDDSFQTALKILFMKEGCLTI